MDPDPAREPVYKVYARWSAGADRATNATYEVTHLGGTTTVTVDQRQRVGEWVYLGGYSMVNGQGHKVRLTYNANRTREQRCRAQIDFRSRSAENVPLRKLVTDQGVPSSPSTCKFRCWRWHINSKRNFDKVFR